MIIDMKYCPKDYQTQHQYREFLDNLVNDICSTYEDQQGINHIEGFNLPSESEVLRILSDLLEVIFPGFSGKKDYCIATIRYNIGEIVARIFVDLADQLSRSFRFDCNMKQCDNCNIPELSDKATRKLLKSIPKIREMMKMDVAAAFDGDPAAKSFDEIIISYPGIKAITIQRLAHILYEENVPLLPRMMGEYAHSITGIDIHPGAILGTGIFIDHGTGVVIGETAEIGDNVKIYQGVTLGALSFPKDACGKIIKGKKRHPTLEKNVTVYAGATILGNITIGEGSVIGGNVWLTESLEPGTKITISPPEHTIKNKGTG